MIEWHTVRVGVDGLIDSEARGQIAVCPVCGGMCWSVFTVEGAARQYLQCQDCCHVDAADGRALPTIEVWSPSVPDQAAAGLVWGCGPREDAP
jgi:hypothetical protein